MGKLTLASKIVSENEANSGIDVAGFSDRYATRDDGGGFVTNSNQAPEVRDSLPGAGNFNLPGLSVNPSPSSSTRPTPTVASFSDRYATTQARQTQYHHFHQAPGVVRTPSGVRNDNLPDESKSRYSSSDGSRTQPSSRRDQSPDHRKLNRAQSGNRYPRRPHSWTYERERFATHNVRIICCWVQDPLGGQTFWERLHKACGSQLVKKVDKVERIAQRDGTLRFDVWVRSEYSDAVVRKMRKYGTGWKWTRVRFHIPFWERARKRTLPITGQLRKGKHSAPPNPQSSLSLCTYNINGLRKKRPDLKFLLEETGLECLALQETLLRPTDWSLTIPNYHCFNIVGGHHASKRGVALLINKKHNGSVVGKSSPWFVLVRIYSKFLRQPHILGSVYIPHGRDKPQALELLGQQVRTIRTAYPAQPLILMGDWNMDQVQTQKILNEWNCGLVVAPNMRNTRVNGRCVDHIVGTHHCTSRLSPVKVLYCWDLSDHFPVSANLSVDALVDGGRKPTSVGTNGPSLKKRIYWKHDTDPEKVASSNYWDPLRDLMEQWSDDTAEVGPEVWQTRGDQLAEKWVSVSHKLAEELNLHATPPLSRNSCMNNRVKRAIRRRRIIATQLRLDSAFAPRLTLAQRLELEESLKVATELAEELKRSDSKRRFRKRVQKACIQMRHPSECRKFWRWASNMAGWKRNKGIVGVQPVIDPVSNELVMGIEAIGKAWENHFSKLAADETGNSRDPTKWPRHNTNPTLESLNRDFGYGEVMGCLQKLRHNKAPGPDGVISEFLQSCVKRGVEPGSFEHTPMGLALVGLINTMWKYGVIPKTWQNSIVVAIPKKGDLADMNNYRGISLMGTVLKVLCSLLSTRLNEELETRHLFTPEQAGFRKREECTAQAAALLEICQRRRLEGNKTYLMFIDLKKAYDTVPHEALFAKLYNMGIRGRLLQFIQRLYALSFMRVRVGYGTDAILSPMAQLLRGLRQG